MLELLIDNKNGKVWDISQIASGIKWKTSRIGKAGSLDFTLIKNAIDQDKDFQFSNGDVIRFRVDGRNIFYGYIFSIDSGKDEGVKILAYDQIRYLMASDTYVLKNITASDVIRRIAKDFNLQVGRVDDTVYKIPTMVEDGKKLLDIIDKALTLTLHNTNRNFFLFDDFGSLSVRNVEDMLVDFYIGEGSLLTDYKLKKSIDSETYNKIKLYQDNKKTKKREVYVSQDSANIAKWGTLQLYQSVDEHHNAAQINELLKSLMTIKNRESKTISIEAMGDLSIRAGSFVPIVIEEFGINQPFLVDECAHSFDGDDHTISLELKVI